MQEKWAAQNDCLSEVNAVSRLYNSALWVSSAVNYGDRITDASSNQQTNMSYLLVCCLYFPLLTTRGANQNQMYS